MPRYCNYANYFVVAAESVFAPTLSGGPCDNLTSRSKKTRRAREANPQERAAFVEKQLTLPVERLWFIDEFGIHLAMSPTYARALPGERAEMLERFEKGANIWSSVGSGCRACGLR